MENPPRIVLTYVFLNSFLLSISLLSFGATFFFPMSGMLSCLILSLGGVWAASRARRFSQKGSDPFVFFISSPSSRRLSPRAEGLLLGLLPLLLLLAFRPSIDVDPMIYHLPLAKLMNLTRTFGGIAQINAHYALPNGTSVLASLFTWTGILGFENIPTLLISYALFIGIFLFLFQTTSLSIRLSALFALSLSTSPDLMGQAYNMGTDLPQAYFLCFGLLAWHEEAWRAAWLYLGLACLFKSQAWLVFAAFSGTQMMNVILFRQRRNRVFPIREASLGICLIGLSWLRVFASSGNPLFPIVPMAVLSDSVPLGTQAKFIRSLHDCNNADRSLIGLPGFLWNLLFDPQKLMSKAWFWPVLFATALFKPWRKLNSMSRNTRWTSVTLTLTVALSLVFWHSSSPFLRFILGFLIFWTLIWIQQSIQSPAWKNAARRRILIGITASVALIFIGNGFRHFYKYIWPFIYDGRQKAMAQLFPYRINGFSFYTSPDGLKYSVAEADVCGHQTQPCFQHSSDITPLLHLMESKRKW